jgi:DNA-binding MarR family transcriptional regulator
MAENPFDHTGFDDVIHGRLRLGVIAYLAAVETALFTELRDKVGATDGNLSVQIAKLEEAGYVDVAKSFAGRKPQTRLTLTHRGRQAWINWLDRIDKLTRAAASTGR